MHKILPILPNLAWHDEYEYVYVYEYEYEYEYEYTFKSLLLEQKSKK